MNTNNNLNDYIRQQMLTMGLMSNNHDNNNFFMVIFGIIVMQIIEFITKWIPVVVEYVNNYIHKRFQEAQQKAEKQLTNKFIQEKTGTIKFIYSSGMPSDKIDSIIDYMSRKNEALKLIFSSNYIVDNDSEFKLNNSITCKIISTDLNEHGNLEKMTFIITSETYQLTDLQEWVNQVEEAYKIAKNNKLGNKRFYFNSIEQNSRNLVNKHGYSTDTSSNIHFKMNEFQTNKSLNNLFGREIDLIKKRVNTFINRPDWYREKGIPYTFGMLFHGPPGCGKSSTIKAIARDTQRHIINIRITKSTTKTQLSNLFYNDIIYILDQNGKTVTYNIPINQRIYVFEEIDTIGDIIMDRKLKEKLIEIEEKEESSDKGDDLLNLGFLLELFDGVLETPGRIMILTTNHKEHIDPALLRPGRIDLDIEFGLCDNDMLSDMFIHFFGKNPNFDKNFTNKITPAEAGCIITNNMDNCEKAIIELNKKINNE